MARRRSGGFKLGPVVKVAAEVIALNATSQIVTTLPSIPPAVKAFVGVGVAVANVEILGKAAETMLPAGPARTIAKALIDVQGIILTVQQLPNIIAAVSSIGQAVSQ